MKENNWKEKENNAQKTCREQALNVTPYFARPWHLIMVSFCWDFSYLGKSKGT